MTSKFPLSQKYMDFINSVRGVSADFLEGTTASGKTTVGAGIKFMRMVSASRKKLHVIAAKTTGKAEETIIQQDNGILDLHTNARYFGNGDKDYKLPHIKFEGKIIYVLGYDNKDKWEMVLGAQFGCVYIDEINTADIEFVREMSTRNDYLMATLNPDDPFRDNLSLTDEDIKRKMAAAPKGTKLYKNKILGLRGRATGLVFDLQKRNIITAEQAKAFTFVYFSAGLDTAYSQSSPDTIAFTFVGITADRKCVTLDEEVYNNRDRQVPLTPSDIPKIFTAFLEKNRRTWGFARDVYIDSADQATILECQKFGRLTGSIYNFIPAFKKTKIIDRIHLQSAWLAAGDFYILEHCKEYADELNIYSWKEDKAEPEDGNDHLINSCQYAWLPYRDKIGSVKID